MNSLHFPVQAVDASVFHSRGAPELCRFFNRFFCHVAPLPRAGEVEAWIEETYQTNPVGAQFGLLFVPNYAGRDEVLHNGKFNAPPRHFRHGPFEWLVYSPNTGYPSYIVAKILLVPTVIAVAQEMPWDDGDWLLQMQIPIDIPLGETTNAFGEMVHSLPRHRNSLAWSEMMGVNLNKHWYGGDCVALFNGVAPEPPGGQRTDRQVENYTLWTAPPPWSPHF